MLVLAFDLFDLAGAHDVVDAVRADPDAVVVDLSRAREVHDHAVATLAAIAARSDVPLRVLGLREHDRRMLRYLGFEAAELFAG